MRCLRQWQVDRRKEQTGGCFCTWADEGRGRGEDVSHSSTVLRSCNTLRLRGEREVEGMNVRADDDHVTRCIPPHRSVFHACIHY